MQIREVIKKDTDGFFGNQERVIAIIDYPLRKYQQEILTRIRNKLPFSQEEII